MSGTVNKVILIGYVSREPEIRTFQSGDKVASFSIATSESWKDKQTGERKERTEFTRVSVFNEPLIQLIQAYVKKGSKLYLSGQLETKKYTDKAGVEKYATEVVLRPFKGELTLMDNKDEAHAKEEKEVATKAAYNAPSLPLGDLDDNIPF